MVMKTRLIAPLLAILLSGCITEKDEENIGIQRGDALPDFSVDLSDGRRISADDMKGKRVLIEFSTLHVGIADGGSRLWIVYILNIRIIRMCW